LIAAAAAPSDIMAEEKKLLESRRAVRLEEVKPSIPARKTAGATPNEHATRRMKASENVNVILSLVNFKPSGNRKCCTNLPSDISAGTSARNVSCSRHP